MLFKKFEFDFMAASSGWEDQSEWTLVANTCHSSDDKSFCRSHCSNVQNKQQ